MTVDTTENEYWQKVHEHAQLEPHERNWGEPLIDIDRFGKREQLVREYAWAIPNNAALDQLARMGPLLEIGAGGGYWAHLLRERGVDIVATDDGSWPTKLWTEVVNDSAEAAVKHYPGRSLFFCWPTMARWAGQALERFGELGGTEVAYVGEFGGGCTADDHFHEQLEEKWLKECVIEIPRYLGLHDALHIYSKGVEQ